MTDAKRATAMKAKAQTVRVDSVLRELKRWAKHLDAQLDPPLNPPGSLERVRIIYRMAGIDEAMAIVESVADRQSQKGKRR